MLLTTNTNNAYQPDTNSGGNFVLLNSLHNYLAPLKQTKAFNLNGSMIFFSPLIMTLFLTCKYGRMDVRLKSLKLVIAFMKRVYVHLQDGH